MRSCDLLPAAEAWSAEEEHELVVQSASGSTSAGRRSACPPRAAGLLAAGLLLALAVAAAASRCRLLRRGGAPEGGSGGGAVSLQAAGFDTCARDYSHDCRQLPCCNPLTTCYSKDETWAACRPACALGVAVNAPPWDPEADGLPWECSVVGDQPAAPTWSPSSDSPSLFCFALTEVRGSEPELIRKQLATGVGIFGCSDFSLFSERKMFFGPGPRGMVETTPIGGPMSTSEHNTPEFIRVWTKVREQGLYKTHEWVAKLDPDTVFFPTRLQRRLSQLSSSQPVVLRNCWKFQSVQGSLETYSRASADTFLESLDKCASQEYMMQRGEDWFFHHCLVSLGVASLEAYDLLTDKWCDGSDHCDAGRAAFHPFKTVEAFDACVAAATAGQPGPGIPVVAQ